MKAFFRDLASLPSGEALALDVGRRAALIQREALDRALQDLWIWRECHRRHPEFRHEFGRVSLEIDAVVERARNGGAEGCGL